MALAGREKWDGHETLAVGFGLVAAVVYNPTCHANGAGGIIISQPLFRAGLTERSESGEMQQSNGSPPKKVLR